jgi:hypothetical protein
MVSASNLALLADAQVLLPLGTYTGAGVGPGVNIAGWDGVLVDLQFLGAVGGDIAILAGPTSSFLDAAAVPFSGVAVTGTRKRILLEARALPHPWIFLAITSLSGVTGIVATAIRVGQKGPVLSAATFDALVRIPEA